jgi:hypothetical protein
MMETIVFIVLGGLALVAIGFALGLLELGVVIGRGGAVS